MNKILQFLILLFFCSTTISGQSWIRINQLGYLPGSVKVAVFISKEPVPVKDFTLCDAITGKVVFRANAVLSSGDYWGMKSAAQLDFSNFESAGGYFLRCGNAESEPFRIAADVYKGVADYILRYMRQQRCGYNPYYADSCHTHDGFIVDRKDARDGNAVGTRLAVAAVSAGDGTELPVCVLHPVNQGQFIGRQSAGAGAGSARQVLLDLPDGVHAAER